MDVNKTDLKVGVIVAVVLLGLYAVVVNSETHVEETSSQLANPISSSGDASTSTSDGRVMVVRGGALNDTMNIFASFNKNGETIRSLDCSNGTGNNCILVFDK